MHHDRIRNTSDFNYLKQVIWDLNGISFQWSGFPLFLSHQIPWFFPDFSLIS